MNLNKIQMDYFVGEVKKIPTLRDGILYSKFERKWTAHNDAQVIDKETMVGLEFLSQDKRHIRLNNPPRLVLSFGKVNCAISIKIGQKIRESTILQHLTRLDECERSSVSLFHANHDELTGVLNRNGVRHRLESSYVKSKKNNGGESSESVSGRNEIIVYSFDIDKFKSVNDVYGHEAGDVVLAAFANRLNRFKVELEKLYPAKFIFGRPGGEEFEMIVLGSLSFSDKKEIGDQLINTIRNPTLPSHQEIDEYASKKKVQTSKFDYGIYPSGIKASIGVAWGRVDIEHREETHKRIRKQADAALYRAKSDGRNCLRIYSEIKSKHGRIVKFFEDSETLQIDIGSNVGVRNGEVYSVSFPPFTGNENVQEGSGGEKILGQYPVVESGKVVVLKSDREFSTCMVLSSVNKKPFPKGGRLNYLHMGSEQPILDRVVDHASSIGGQYEFDNHVDFLVAQGRFLAVCWIPEIFDFDDNEVKKASIDVFFSAMMMVFPAKTQFFKPNNGGFFIALEIFENGGIDFKNFMKEVFEKLKDFIGGLKIYVFMHGALPYGIDVASKSLRFYCRSLSNKVQNEKDDVSYFSELSSTSVIHGWRTKRFYKDALYDYKKFRSLGFSSPSLDNQIGLVIYEADAEKYFNFSELAFLNAIAIDPENFHYKVNLATIGVKMGKYLEAYNGFKSVEGDIEKFNGVYISAYGKSIVEVYKDGKISASSSVGSMLLKAVDALNAKNTAVNEPLWLEEIKAILSTGNFD